MRKGLTRIQLMLLAAVLGLLLMVVWNLRGLLADEGIATRTLEAQGYSDIKVADKAWFMVGFRGCSKDDAAKFTAVAENPAGQEVEVEICAGAFVKGGTIRVR